MKEAFSVGREAADVVDTWTGRTIERTCRSCVHFDDDPGHLESEVPGILVFGSGYSSARGHAGMCRRLDRFLDPILAGRCSSFEALEWQNASTSSPG